MTNQELGILGENMATLFLQKKGHKIRARNFRMRHLEVDIITEFEDKIHVTEVKTRQTAEIGEPWRAVTRAKQKQIVKVADFYLKENEIELETQFDIVSIVHNTYRTDLEYIPDAFTPFL
ncbi:MAG: YraN family protein [Crocinitomicaceae bacterium]|jgi:putative endonuclease|nr:YraN family protein [Crocinitomicaceae bacterium]MDG2465458.1 YraN family protein [Crocinitomicaceae bacterium]